MKKQKLLKKISYTLLFTVVTTILFTAFAAWNPLNKWQLKLTNHLYDRNEPSSEVVIVGIDDSSISDEGLGRWQDWSRLAYVDVVNNLEKAGAKTIGFDIFFTRSSNGISEESLVDIIGENPTMDEYFEQTVEFLKDEHPEDIALAEVFEKYDNIVIADKIYMGEGNYIIESDSTLELFQDHIESAHLFYVPDTDDVVRRVPTKISTQDGSQTLIALSAVLAENYKPGALDNLEGNELLINYAAPPYNQQMIPFMDVYNNLFEEEAVKDKIVLIGVVTDFVEDHVLTPTSPYVEMPGVEMHANAIQTILDESYLTEQGVVGQALMMAALTFVLIGAVMFLPIFGGVGATVVVIAGHQLSAPLFFDKGLIINLVYPALALLAAYLTTTLYKYMTEVREKAQLKGAFGKYVNKDLANKILENPEMLKLGGEKRVITVFFSDIANFTHFSEQCEPEALVQQLNEYFDVMASIILKNGGNLNKFEGDAIMAFWGAPLDQADHAVLGAKSALECRAALTSLHQKWGQEGKPLLNFRVGLSTGEVIAGNVGSHERFDYTVMGDIVNLGARLESANKEYGTHVMIPGATVAAIGDLFELRRLDRLRVKGKEEPVDVYELLAHKGQLADQHRTIVDQFHQAIEYYRNQKFTEAEARFQEVLKLAPNDGPTKTYLERCAHFKANPPQGWDATWTLDHK
jgi:adenylate cyclase